MIRPDLTLPIPDDITAAHFIGIGGSGMSGLAGMFLDRGIRVSGSDRADSAALRALAARGADVHVGHDAANLPADADTVVHTGAIWPENPEFLLAKERGLHVIHRSQALHWLIGGRRLVSVAGAHGKTTSTGMIVTALRAQGADPTFVSGGVIADAGVSSGTGSDDLFVIEADESDGTFLLYDTSIALITNVDPDHLDHWGTRDAFYDAFVTFGNEAREAVVISSDDPGAQRVAAALTHRVVTFGEDASADVRVSGIDTHGPVSFTLTHAGVSVAGRLAVPGAHNAVNAAGAVAVLLTLGYELEPALRAVEGFGGTVRRFELHGVQRGVSVYDDYAHHPTEVAAALAAARSVVGEGRIIAIQQPHTYSRTQEMYREFAEVLEAAADHTVMLDVYGAREDPVPGVTGALVSGAFADPEHVHFVPDWQQAADYTASIARPGDYVITLGCGNVYQIIPQVLQALAETETGAPAETGA